jgi:hypothetical protein
MKALIFALFFLPVLAHADISTPRAKQYAYTVFDVANGSGASVPHSQGLVLTAGSIITNAWVYINTQFAASGTESLGISCAGSQDIMAYLSVKNIVVNKVLQAQLGSYLYGATAVIGAAAQTVDVSGGFGSIPTDCQVVVNVRGDAGYTPYTGGKLTAIIEFFKL